MMDFSLSLLKDRSEKVTCPTSEEAETTDGSKGDEVAEERFVGDKSASLFRPGLSLNERDRS